MIKLFSTAAVVSAVFMFSFTAKAPHGVNYKLDAKASNVQWFAEKVTGKHNGIVTLSNGTLTDTHGEWTGAFDMDMSTITVVDLEAGKGKEKLEGHLKSPDFFDVEKYKTAKLVVSSIKPMAEPKDEMTHTATGFLTIKDKSNPVTFNLAIKNDSGKMMCNGSLVIDRTKYDVRYGSKSFFADIGDKAIMDEFTLKFNVVLAQ